MTEIQDKGNVPQQHPITYKEDYKESINLFEKSFKEFTQAKEAHIKDKFKDVMNKTLHIMNQCAQKALSTSKQKENTKLHSDYHEFMGSQTNENEKKIHGDIANLKEGL